MRKTDVFCCDWRFKGLLLKAQITLNLYIVTDLHVLCQTMKSQAKPMNGGILSGSAMFVQIKRNLTQNHYFIEILSDSPLKYKSELFHTNLLTCKG